MRLFIAEKPDLAKAIAEGLGGGRSADGYIVCGDDYVTWCFGHMLQLFDPEDYDAKYEKWDMAHLPIVHVPWKKKVSPDKKKQVKIILDLLKKADSVVNAGDPDEEGQLLVDELLQYAKCRLPVKRVLINDNNTAVVRKSLANLRDNAEFAGLSAAAEARSVADQLYGYNGTRLYTLAGRSKGYSGVLSVGRVQTPILGLVVRRDRQHESHQKSYFHTITGTFGLAGTSVNARYQISDNDPVDDKGRIIDASFAERVAAECQGAPATVAECKSDIKKEQPPLPYNLLKLQADCSRKFGLKPDQVLSITQTLREKHRLITYNRSDSEYLSDEQHADAPDVLAAIAGTAPVLAKAAGGANPSVRSRAFNSAKVSAHHAIVPTSATADFNALSESEKKVYLLIARAYVAQFFPVHEYRETTLTIDCKGHSFKVTSKTTLSPGWLALYRNDKDNDELPEDAECDSDLSQLSQGTSGTCEQCRSERRETKPPARYTMTTLLKDLTRVAKYVNDPKLKKMLQEKDADKAGEHGGIGTPATRSSIIKNLFDRGFLAEKGKSIISTDVGRQLFDTLPERATVPDMTALWHEQQTQIKQGELTVEQFIHDIVAYITEEIDRVKSEGLSLKVDLPKCPTCKEGFLRSRKGSKGNFWGCTNYPDCKATFPDAKGKPDFSPRKPKPAAVVSEQHKCQDCGKGLIRRPGKKKGTFFWGCSGFPECRTSYFDKGGKPVLETAKAG
ncbi:DNA topoisomerase 3 [Kistimonas asteriae]|uniref:DNA topoisomerase 3 n=1 Tax=Kistimonas asteriae TaxID=517724 RepID=UPI001BAD6A03|nr:DNA topoisomerase 3 [Kistimonas asteriae]